jgi:hypothetical protein
LQLEGQRISDGRRESVIIFIGVKLAAEGYEHFGPPSLQHPRELILSLRLVASVQF